MSKLPQQIKNQLKGLKNISLDADFKDQQRNLLLAEIGVENTQVKREFIAKEVFSLYIKDWTSTMTWRSIGAMFLVFGVVIGPGIATVSASRASLPGDTLYSIKRGIEKAKISVSFTNKTKAKLEIAHVENRIYELARLTQEQAPSSKRTENVAIALVELKKDTDSVKERIELLIDESNNDQQDDKKKQGAAEVALLVQEKTTIVQESIKSAVQDLAIEGDDEAKADVKEALDLVNDVALDALVVIVDTHEDGDESISSEDLKELVTVQLENAKELVEILSEVTETEEEATDEEVTEEEATDEEVTDEEITDEATGEEVTDDEETTDEEVAEEEATGEEVKIDVEEVKIQLEEELVIIEKLIEMDNLSQAVEKIAETNTDVTEINVEQKEMAVEEAGSEEESVEPTDEPIDEAQGLQEEAVDSVPGPEEQEETPLIDDISSE